MWVSYILHPAVGQMEIDVESIESAVMDYIVSNIQKELLAICELVVVCKADETVRITANGSGTHSRNYWMSTGFAPEKEKTKLRQKVRLMTFDKVPYTNIILYIGNKNGKVIRGKLSDIDMSSDWPQMNALKGIIDNEEIWKKV